jgi:hypothetical protein
MSIVSRQRAFILFSIICLICIVATSHGLTSARVASTDGSIPTATSPPSAEGGEVDQPLDSPLPTPTPTETSEVSHFGWIVLTYLAEQKGAPIETLLLESEHPRSYPLLEREFMAFTILDTNDSQAFVLLVDINSEEVVDLAVMEQANGEAHFAKYGKLDPVLYERLQSVDGATSLPVAVWVASNYGEMEAKLRGELASKYPEVAEALARNASPFDVADTTLSDALRKEWAEMLQRDIDAALAPLVASLEAEGIVVEKPGHLPSLIVTLTKQQIQALSERADVQLLFLVEGEGEPALNTATPTDRVPSVWHRGVNGAGRTIAIVEDGNVDHDNLYLNVSGTQRAGCTGENNHATQVASAAASTHTSHRGMAFGATILSAGVNPCTEPEIYNSLGWALDNVAHVVNVSYGVDSNTSALQWNDVAFDYAARSRPATIVVAAGNWRNRHIYSPGKAWNIITVGGTNNQDTAAWDDDQMYQGPQANEGSAYFNPAGGSQGDREKPEVVAPGQWIEAIGPNNALLPADRGTSFAAPQVSGLAAVMMHRNAQVYNYPLAVKAIIMATAVHNIEGDRRLSNEDGAGGIDAALADYVVQTQAGDGISCAIPCWWAFNTTSNNPGVGADKSQTFQANRGERIRVAIAWWSAAGSPPPFPLPGVDALATNFDLRVYKPSDANNPVSTSTSVDNNYELVDFTAPETGTYTIRVRKQSAGESDNALGIAWVKLGSYLPEVRRNHDGWSSTIYVRNDGAEPWSGRVSFFDQNGNFAGDVNTTLQPGTVWNGPLPPNNWQGTAIINGNDDISVVVRHDKSGLATLDNAFTHGGATDPAWGQALPSPGSALYGPVIYKNIFGGFNSSIYIQNLGAAAAQMVVILYGRAGYPADEDHVVSLSAHKQEILTPAQIFGNNNAWVGSLGSGGERPFAIRIFESKGTGESRSFNTAATGRQLVYVPAAYRNAFNLITGLVVQQVGGFDNTNVTLTYCERLVTNPANCPTQVITLTPQRAEGVNLNNAPVLNGWSGSVKIESTLNMPLAVAVTNSRTDFPGGYSFNGTGYGSKLIILPRAAKDASGRTTGYTVRNVSGQNNVTVTARYYTGSTGALVSTGRTFTLQNAQTDGYHQSNDTFLPAGWEGSIVLEASAGIIAIMREDTSTTISGYNGVSR